MTRTKAHERARAEAAEKERDIYQRQSEDRKQGLFDTLQKVAELERELEAIKGLSEIGLDSLHEHCKNLKTERGRLRDVVGNHMVKAIRRLKARSKSRGLRYEAEKEAHANTRAQLAEAESRAVAYFNDMQTSDHLLAEAREVLESYRIVPDLDQYENQVVSCGYCGHIFQSGEWEDHNQRLYQSSEWSERHCPLAAVLGGGLPESQSVTESVTKGEDNDA